MNKIIAVVVLLGLVWFGASPYITAHQIKSAAQDQDGESLSEYIEFPTLRQNFKDQLNVHMAKEMSSEMEDNPFAALGAALGSMIVDKMVDAYVTPAAITEMMKGEKPKKSSGSDSEQETERKEIFENAKMSYEAWNKFAISFPNDSMGQSKFVLRRRGIGWKLTNIVIPLTK